MADSTLASDGVTAYGKCREATKTERRSFAVAGALRDGAKLADRYAVGTKVGEDVST